ncbi:hypothetical protein QBC44DRAFT_372210 [Cladorrhinum sp. PSN332]|nr:hypothetical protein QBC44DRAFT_372210 [Cladorrhinum sp. PSN332]
MGAQSTLICSTVRNHVGCCPSGVSCLPYTSCLDSIAFNSGLCTNLGSLTTCCSNSCSQYRNTFTYADLAQQSNVGCGSLTFFGVTLYANPTISSSTSTYTSSSTTTTTIPPTPIDSGLSPAAVGGIVGGAVGGLALLAAIAGLIAWCLIRKRKKKRVSTLAATAVFPVASGGYGPSPLPSPGIISETANSPFGYHPRHSMLKLAHWDQGAHGGQSVSPGPQSPPHYKAYSPYGAGVRNSIAEAVDTSAVRETAEPAPIEIGGTERTRERAYEM